MTITLKDKYNALTVNYSDFAEIRKRAKHSAELATLNPKNELLSTHCDYIKYCSEFFIQLIDAHRKTKSSFRVETEYFSKYCDQVIGDDNYPELLKRLTAAKRRLARLDDKSRL
jgi:hypothetical protein